MEPFDIPNTLYWAKMREDALIPQRNSENAGYDIYASFDEDYILVEPYKTRLIPTGICFAVSEDYYLQLEERSSTGLKGLKRSGGVIDSGYRGEIKVAIFNANDKPIVFSPYGEDYLREKYNLDDFIFYSTSKAIAQGIIHRVESMNEKEISLEQLKQIPSKRGDKGWGSTNEEEKIQDTLKIIKEKAEEKIKQRKNVK